MLRNGNKLYFDFGLLVILIYVAKFIGVCLAVPGKIVEINGRKAKVDYGGILREIDVSLVDVKVGDYVIVHAGFAIQVLDEKDAKETLRIFEEMLKNA